MNLSLNGQKKKQVDGVKRSIHHLSEEELSDRRSTSSTDSTVEQRNENENKYQRSTRRAANKPWVSYLDCDDVSSDEWNAKSYADDSSDHSDPAWTPAPIQSNSLAPPKLTPISKIIKPDGPQIYQKLVPIEKKVREEIPKITEEDSPPKLKAALKKKRGKKESAKPPILVKAESPIGLIPEEEGKHTENYPKPPKLKATPKKKRGSQDCLQPPILERNPMVSKENQKSLLSMTPPNLLETDDEAEKVRTIPASPPPLIPIHMITTEYLDSTPPQAAPKLTSHSRKKQLSQGTGSAKSTSPPSLEPLEFITKEYQDDTSLQSPPKLTSHSRKKRLSQETSSPPFLTEDVATEIQDQKLASIRPPPKLTKRGRPTKRSSQELSLPPDLAAEPSSEITKDHQDPSPSSPKKKKSVKKKKKTTPKPPPMLKAELKKEADILEVSPQSPVLSVVNCAIAKESESDSLDEPPASEKAELTSVYAEEDPKVSPIQEQTLASIRPPPKLTKRGRPTKRGSQELSLPPELAAEPSSEITKDHRDPSPSSPKRKKSVKKKKKATPKPLPILKSEPNKEADIPEVSPQSPVLSVVNCTIAKESERDSLDEPPASEMAEPTSVIAEEDQIPQKPTSPSPAKRKSSGKRTKSSLKPSDPPVLQTVVPISGVLIKESENESLLSPPKQKTPVKKKVANTKPSPLKTAQPTKREEMQVSTFESADSTALRPQIQECSLSFAGIISHNASLLEKGFDSGKFIMLKSDFKTQKSPCIWRIDGKNLLQKYEPISYNNGTAYRNISTYSSWMATNKGLYVPIEVEFSVQSKSETIVTFDRSRVMLPVEDEMMEVLNNEANGNLDTFQIYLQTLISQALDSNFVKEIVKEQDDYFLTSIAVIEDEWILPKRKMLKEVIKMKKPFQELLETHPGLDLRCVTSGDKSCDTCGGRNPTRSFEFQPLIYSFDTLDISEGRTSTKIYRLCLSCTDRVLLYHELFHLRYHLFTCCQAKVKQYEQCDGPAALTSSLADLSWKSFMHRKVLLVVAETQQVVSQCSAADTFNTL